MSFAPRMSQGTNHNGVVGLLSSRLGIAVLCGLCLVVLAGEVGWREHRLHQLKGVLDGERATMAAERAADVAKQDQAMLAEVQREQNTHQASLTNTALLSGALARERHEKEWALRLAHDPRFAKTAMETNLMEMESLGRDPAITAQAALEKVATLAAPRGSRVEVVPAGDNYRVRVAFMMSTLSGQETGAVTKHTSISSLRGEIQDLSAQVLRDLYDYCGSRGIESVSVACNHTVRERFIPETATPAERTLLLQNGKLAPFRLYRMSLSQSQAAGVSDWRTVSLSRVAALSTIEDDGLRTLTIGHSISSGDEAQDAPGELEF